MAKESTGLPEDIDALRIVLRRLMEEERDLNRLVTGVARLMMAIVHGERLRHQMQKEESESEYA